MTSLVPPLLVAEGWDLTFYRSADDISAQLEPWYVEEDYQAWDALGRPFRLVLVEPERSRGLRRLRDPGPLVKPRLDSDATGGGDECAAYLRDWLREIGAPAPAPEASLSDLLVQGLIRGHIWGKP